MLACKAISRLEILAYIEKFEEKLNCAYTCGKLKVCPNLLALLLMLTGKTTYGMDTTKAFKLVIPLCNLQPLPENFNWRQMLLSVHPSGVDHRI